jgi:hypothetical protein
MAFGIVGDVGSCPASAPLWLLVLVVGGRSGIVSFEGKGGRSGVGGSECATAGNMNFFVSVSEGSTRDEIVGIDTFDDKDLV